jgi:acyl-CoA thioesterase FadM
VRTEYLEQFGYEENSTFEYSLMVVEANCQYKRELSEGDKLRIYCRPVEITTKMLRMQFQIKDGDVLCAEGSATYLCYSYEFRKVISIPDDLVARIKAFEK